MEQQPNCLTVGGSDSCGGAGIQADLRVFAALGVHACSAITALTAQNPRQISHIEASSLPHFTSELSAIADFYPIKVIKTGMLYDETHLKALISSKISHFHDAKLVVDPVFIASSGTSLFQSTNIRTAYADLLQHATLWTPNLQEAAYLLEQQITDPVELAAALLLKYRTPVLLKGGHGKGETLRDIFCDQAGNIEIFEHQKQSINQAQAHGTGCRLASAVAAHLAHHEPLLSAISKAHRWLQNDLLRE